jgi:hypothetical protein
MVIGIGAILIARANGIGEVGDGFLLTYADRKDAALPQTFPSVPPVPYLTLNYEGRCIEDPKMWY